MDFFNTEALLNLFTLTGLEIILGIDNVIFIALLVQHLEKNLRKKARFIGLSLALIFRIIMLFCATWIMKLTKPLFTIFSFDVSGRSLLLIIGGLFLVVKGALELIEMFKKDHQGPKESKETKFFKIISQIIFIDVILSFDSIITAVALTNELSIMIIAVVIAMIIMLISASKISKYIYENPSIKVLALAFIIMVGVLLTLNGFDIYIDKAYLYFAIFFSSTVEAINLRLRKRN
jgi:predicted tellurium resistance membrane protein TerC